MIGDRNGTEVSNGTAGDDEQAVTASDLFEVLGEPSRRRVLRGLHEIEGRVHLHELADQLADRRAGSTDGRADRSTGTPGRPAEGDSDRLAIRLHHSHLPKLDDCGLADYDPESNTVVAQIPAWVEPYLDAVADD